MSNSVSAGIGAATRHSASMPQVPPVGGRQTQFENGTQNLLDEARNMVENAVGQGQDLNPMIYQYLGLTPQYEDHSADISSAQQEFDAAQKQLSEAQSTLASLKGIPKGMRTPAQKAQFRQLTKQMPQLNRAVEIGQNSLGRLQTMPKTITGVSRSDPSQIPADSPFSPQNPLNQTAQAEAQMAQRYATAGSADTPEGRAAAIDPTLVHQWTQAEAQLRQVMSSRYGPDWENSTVGQAALSAFNRQKSEQYAQWNMQQLTAMQSAATTGFSNLQSLAANQLGLWREPSNTAIGMGNQLSNLAGNRLTEQQTFNQRLGMHVGLQENVTQTQPLEAAKAVGAGLGSILNTPTSGGGTVGGSAAGAIGRGWNDLFGTGTGAATDATSNAYYSGISSAGEGLSSTAAGTEAADMGGQGVLAADTSGAGAGIFSW